MHGIASFFVFNICVENFLLNKNQRYEKNYPRYFYYINVRMFG
jgi:hypothetical protein